MIECPYPKVSKYQNKNISDSSQEKYESMDRRFKRDKWKAFISDPLENCESEISTSSDESDSSEEDTALLCLVNRTFE